MSSEEDDTYKRYILKKQIEFLRTKKGYHTELITLMIPPNRKISDVTNYLKNEISESSNIKSKLTRKNVIDSINALLQKLKNIRQLPKNGLIMFAGAIPQGNTQGTEKIELYMIEPIEPITHFKYYCSSEFYLEPLEKMLKEKDTYGIIAIDRKDFAIGWVRGSHLEVVKTTSSGVGARHHAGGQSQRRFERLHDEQVNAFLTRCSEITNEVFVPMVESGELKGILIGGAGNTKRKFVEKGLLDYRLRDKIIDFYDIGVSGAEGLRAILLKAKDKLSNLRYTKEKKIMERFLYNLAKDNGLIAYGEKEVRDALIAGAVDTLLLSEKLQMKRITIKCTQCGYSESKTVKEEELNKIKQRISSTQCPSCASSSLIIDEERDIIDELGEIAQTVGTKVEIISDETEEGETLLSTFGGIAAILRYRLK